MSYTNLLYHIVFRPKNSRKVIDVTYEKELYAYIWGLTKKQKALLIRIGGMPDHIHMLVQLHPTNSVADFVRDLKVSTNVFIKDNKDKFPYFEGWGKSYCALTVGPYDKEGVVEYIKNQKEHHKKFDFYNELRNILKDNGIEVNDNYFLKD